MRPRTESGKKQHSVGNRSTIGSLARNDRRALPLLQARPALKAPGDDGGQDQQQDHSARHAAGHGGH
eukprot:scaffold20660_cov129-Isochrysis_galbana.AAC.1